MLSEKGSLQETPTIKILLTLFEQGLTGILSLKRESIQKILYFTKGNLIWAISNSRNDELDNILVSQDLVAPKNIERVKQMADSPESLGKMLVEKGLITLEDLIRVSRDQLKGIVASVLNWPEGKFQFVRESPPERLLNLELNVTDFIRDFILKGADIGFIRQQVGSVEAEFVKNPDNQKIKRYNFSEQQLQLLDCFDGATSLETVLAKYPEENRESVLKIVYYFLMADILLDEGLEFLDSPALRVKESSESLEVESTGYENDEAAAPEPAQEEPESYGIEREIEVQNTSEKDDFLDSVLDDIAGEEAGQEVYEVESGRLDEKEDDLQIGYEAEEKVKLEELGESREADDMAGEIETGRAEAVEILPGMEQRPPEPAASEVNEDFPAAQEGGEAYEVERNEVSGQEDIKKLPTQPAAPPYQAASPDQAEPLISETPPDVEPVKEIAADGAVKGLDDFELPGEEAAPKFVPDKKEFAPDMEPLKVEEDFIRDREPAPFRKSPVVDNKKKSKLVYLIFLAIAAILIISGAIFLYLNSSKSEVDEDLIPPVNVAEKKPNVQKDGKRTEIPMQKQGKPGQQTQKPGDKPVQATKDQGSKAVSPVQPPGKVHERFGIKSAELKKKLAEKAMVDYFKIKLGDPQAQKYFKQAKFIEAGNTWKKELLKAGMKFTILLEMDCMKESVINALLKIPEKKDFYILNRKLGNRNCFLVMWGKFYTKQEASDALKMIPEYFWGQQHPPKVVPLSRYL